MTWLFRLGILLAFIASTTLHAWTHPQPGGFGIQGEFLYLLPSVSQSYYAQEVSSSEPNGTRYNHELSFQPGYRVLGVYSFCNCGNDIEIIWTHLPRFSETDSVSGALGSIAPTQGTPNTIDAFNAYFSAVSDITLEYQAVDALYGFWGCQCNCFDVAFHTGLHYANLDFKEDIRYNASATNFLAVENHTDVWGIGPELAFEMHYGLPFFQNLICNTGTLSLVSSLRGALLAGRYDCRLLSDASINNTPGFSENDVRWDLIPFWDIRIGLNYCLPFKCFVASLEVGYEMFSYQNAINRIKFVDDISTALSFDSYSDANFQGLYVALGVAF